MGWWGTYFHCKLVKNCWKSLKWPKMTNSSNFGTTLDIPCYLLWVLLCHIPGCDTLSSSNFMLNSFFLSSTLSNTLPHGNPLTSPWPSLITNYKIGRYHITLLRIVSHLHKACSCPLLQIFSANLIHPGHLFVPNPRLFETDNWWIVRLTQ